MLTLLCAVFSMAWGEDKTSTLTFTAACGGNGTASDGVVWTVTSDANESTYDSTKGIHYGTGNAAVSYLQLTTSGITGTISSIVVNASGASNTLAQLNVTVGGENFGGTKNLTSTATDYTFEGSASGTIVVKLSQTSAKKALYVKSIIVTYGDGPVTPPEPKDPDVSFKQDEVNILIGGYYTNTITKPSGLDVEYSLAEGGDAIVQLTTNSAGHPVVKGLSAGSTTVTATWAATTYYNAGNKSFSVIVSKKSADLNISNLSLVEGSTKNLDFSSESDGLVTFEISNSLIASIEKVGDNYVVNGLKAGETTVTATQAATQEFESASKIFVITVKEASTTKLVFYESFDNVTKADGTPAVGGNDGTWQTSSMATLNESQFDNPKGWTIVSGNNADKCIKTGSLNNAGSVTTPAINFEGNVILSFKAGAWDNKDEKTGLKVSLVDGSGTLSKTDLTMEKASWTEFEITILDFTSGSRIKIASSEPGKNCRFFIDEIKLENRDPAPVTATFKKKFKGYTSMYYSDRNLVVPENVTGLTYYVEDGKGHYVSEYPTGSVIPMKTAVVLEYADKDNLTNEVTVTFVDSNESGTAPAKNMLRGFDAAQTTTVDADQDPDDYFFYRFTVGAEGSGKENSVGFYWGAADGAPFTAGAHKVYLAVEKSQFPSEQQASSIFVDDSDNISEITSSEKAIEGVYTLSGSRVFGSNLPKGIYIVNGKKVVIK